MKKKKQNPITDAKKLLILAIAVFIFGATSLVGFYVNLPSANILLAPGETEGTSLNTLFIAGIGLSLLVLIIIQFIFYRSTKKIITSLSESDKEILGSVASIKESKNDELKELVMTRNMLIMKLEANKKALRKIKK